MSRFVLTAQLQLQAPTNVGAVVRQIQSQLNNVQVNVQVQGTQQAQRQVQQLAASTRDAENAAQRLGRTFGLSIKRFAAFAIATRAVSLFTNSLSKAVEEAISFERELVKISQVTGKTLSQLRDLTNEITRLSTGLGVSSTSLLSVSRILSQAGFNADETRIALDALAKTELAPTFENITETAEGAVALFNQFRQGAAALEEQLGAINAVAGKFAVEAGDLIGVVRRVGGVFQASGGDLNELLALFTSVRATTRESAESIATGLRTIFTRIQRPKTIEFLRQYGVELLDLEGKFVGPFEATKRLSEALAGLEQGDITFIRIAEELGGFRQIGKVIPLLQQFRVAQEALNVAQKGSGSLADDAAKAQQALAVRITKVKEEFLALVRSITETTSFQLFANTALSLAEAFIKLADSLKPIIPLLAAVAGFRLATGLGSFVRGIGGGLRTPRGFASGGLVPGSGNRDTVPAMLTPGEFVIRKSSVAKLGASNLAAMNENRYAKGTTGKGVKPIQKGVQVGGVGIFDSDKIPGGTNVKKALLEQLRASKKPYQVIAGPAGSGKTTFATGRFGGNFVLTPADLQKYSRFVVLSGAGKTKSGDFSDDVKGLLSGASGITVLNPGADRLMKQRQGRVDAAMSGNLPDERSIGALQGTMRAPTDSNLDLFRGYGNVNVLDRYAAGGIVSSNRSLYGPKTDFRVIQQKYSSLGLSESQARQVANGTKTIAYYERQKLRGRKQGEESKQGTVKQVTIGGPFGASFLRGYGANVNLESRIYDVIRNGNKTGVTALKNAITQSTKLPFEKAVPKGAGITVKATQGTSTFLDPKGSRIFDDEIMNILPQAFDKAAKKFNGELSIQGPPKPLTSLLSKSAINSIEGQFFEAYVRGITNNVIKDEGNKDAIFDFSSINEEQASKLFGTKKFVIPNEFKNDPNPANIASILAKAAGQVGGIRVQKFATGGAVGTDTVPALLTPGEFVINRQSAQKIGYGSLNRMNKVGKYAKGGVVQKFAQGSSGRGVSPSSNQGLIGGFDKFSASLFGATTALSLLTPTIDESSNTFQKAFAGLTNSLQTVTTTALAVTSALGVFGVNLQGINITKLFGRGQGSIGDLLTGSTLKKGSLIPGRSEYSRRAGTGFNEGFNLVGQRSARAAQIRSLRASSRTAEGMDLLTPDAYYNRRQIKKLRSNPLARPGAVTGRSGAFLGRVASGGGILGKAAGGVAKILGSFGSVLGGLVGPLAAMAGPIALIAGAGAIIGGVISGLRDLEGRLNDAIKAEDTATAQRLATSKALEDSTGGLIAGLVSLGGSGAEEAVLGWLTLLGGPSVESIKTNINAQIESAKAQKSLKETAEKAADAMKEFEAGNISAAEAVKAAAASSDQVYQSRLAMEEANRANTAQRSEGGFAVARNIFTLGGLLGETSGQRNRRIEQENQQRTDEQKKLEEEQLRIAQPAINALGRQFAATGQTLDQFKAQLTQDFGADFVTRNEKVLTDSFNNIAKEAERTRKAFDAMNLGLQSVNAVSGALTVSMGNYLASQEAGYSGLNNTIALLEASVTNAAQGISDADFNAALGSARAGLEKLGASEDDIKKFEENLGAINTAQKFYAKASKDTKDALVAEFQRGAGGPGGAGPTREKFAEVVANQLAGAGIGEAARDRIKDALSNAEISPDDLTAIMGGNMDVLDKVLQDLGETTLNQVIGPLKELAKYEQQLVDITKKRLDLENRVVEAQKGVLAAQLEAQEIAAKYGGAAVTPEMRRQNILGQANIEAQAAGVSSFRTGSAAEINQRSSEIRQGLAQISQIRQQAAAGDKGAQAQLEGQAGVKLAEQEKRLQDLAKSEYDTTKKLIQIKEEELKLVQEKNRLEKSSIEALITGDIDKFFEQQAAVGATAAIALGNQSLMGAFGPDALGAAALDIQRQQEAGVTELYGQQLGGAGGLTERGFASAIAARGVSNPLGMAQVAAGTTAEEEAAKSEIRDLAATLPNYAQTQLQTANQDLNTANIQMRAAEMQLEAAKANVGQRAMGMAKGGVVYANNGMFVPRGTDTIPAMLTPGEFVVRRQAVQRGNNLQLLQAMNRGQSGVSNSGAAVGMAKGGIVRYRENGSNGPEQGGTGFGLSADLINKLSSSLNNFNESLGKNIDRLNSTTLNVKLDTTNVNVNLTGTSFLGGLKDQIKSELMQEVGRQLTSEYRVTDGGKLKKDTGV